MMAVIGHNTFRVFLSVVRAESWPSGSFESSNVRPVSKRKHTAVAGCFVRLRVDDGYGSLCAYMSSRYVEIVFQAFGFLNGGRSPPFFDWLSILM